jgi:hypothetical protein
MNWVQDVDHSNREGYHTADVRSLQSSLVEFQRSETVHTSNETYSNCFYNITSVLANNTAYTVTEVRPQAGSNDTNSGGWNTATTVGHTARCSVSELPDSMGVLATQLIEYQYEIAWDRSNACLLSGSNSTSVHLDSTAQSVEQLLNDYLSQQLLQNCTFRQRYIQFYSISTLPFDQVMDPMVESCSSPLTTDDWDCVRVDGSLTVQTFYKSSHKNRRRKLLHLRNPMQRFRHPSFSNRLLSSNIFTTTTFSDPVLAQKMGSLLVSFFNASLPPVFHNPTLQLQFVAITNFISQDIPTWEKPSHNTTGIDDATMKSLEFRGPSISQTWGIVVVTVTAFAVTLVTLGMIWHQRRKQRQLQRTVMSAQKQKANTSKSQPTSDSPQKGAPSDLAIPEVITSRFYIVGDHDDETIEVVSIGGVRTSFKPTLPIFISAYTENEDQALK